MRPHIQAFFFPGQGAQSVGMAKELVEECPAAGAMFAAASEILGYDLLDVCVNGPPERLNLTVRPARHCSPRHSHAIEPSFLESHCII